METPLQRLQRSMKYVKANKLIDVLVQRVGQIVCESKLSQPIEVPPVVWGVLNKLPERKSTPPLLLNKFPMFGGTRVLRPNVRKPDFME